MDIGWVDGQINKMELSTALVDGNTLGMWRVE